MQYNVGQVIYLLDITRNGILPARVFEQVIKKTIEGEEESFYVEIPGAKELLNLSDFEGAVFIDPSSVKSHLFETLKTNIDSLVEKAAAEALELWGEIVVPAPEQLKKRKRGRPRKVESPTGDEATLIDLGDGRVGRFKN